MAQSIIIGLYHPQRMNRVAITSVLNSELSNRVKHVDHLYDLFSSTYSLVILIEPEILSLEYNPHLVSHFLDHVSKPVVIIPFFDKSRNMTSDNIFFTKRNPTTEELIDHIHRIENDLLQPYSKAM